MQVGKVDWDWASAQSLQCVVQLASTRTVSVCPHFQKFLKENYSGAKPAFVAHIRITFERTLRGIDCRAHKWCAALRLWPSNSCRLHSWVFCWGVVQGALQCSVRKRVGDRIITAQLKRNELKWRRNDARGEINFRMKISESFFHLAHRHPWFVFTQSLMCVKKCRLYSELHVTRTIFVRLSTHLVIAISPNMNLWCRALQVVGGAFRDTKEETKVQVAAAEAINPTLSGRENGLLVQKSQLSLKLFSNLEPFVRLFCQAVIAIFMRSGQKNFGYCQSSFGKNL